MTFFLRATAFVLAAVSLQLPAQGTAQGDAAAGQASSAICAACHGTDGNSTVPQWPKLAGQHAGYLERQTRLIQASARPVPEMAPLVGGLSEADIRNLAAYYSAQSRTGGVAEAALAEAGKLVYQAGNAKTGVPACMACHGPVGEGNPLAGYPALAGQHAVYTADKLTDFRNGEHWGEDDAPSLVMVGAAAELSDSEIHAVSSYIQGLYEAEY